MFQNGMSRASMWPTGSVNGSDIPSSVGTVGSQPVPGTTGGPLTPTQPSQEVQDQGIKSSGSPIGSDSGKDGKERHGFSNFPGLNYRYYIEDISQNLSFIGDNC